MGKLFGTDGIRGVVGENLTVDLAFRVGQAVGTVLLEEKGARTTVVLGKDTRISSDLLEAALIAGLCSVGADVKPVGDIPTPAVAYLTRQEKAEAMFCPEGITLDFGGGPHAYVAFERSGSMSRQAKLSFIRQDHYEPVRRRIMMDLHIDRCQLSKLYAYNGLMLSGGVRIDDIEFE